MLLLLNFFPPISFWPRTSLLRAAATPLGRTSNFWIAPRTLILSQGSGCRILTTAARSATIDVTNANVFCAPVPQARVEDGKSPLRFCIPLFVQVFILPVSACTRGTRRHRNIVVRVVTVECFNVDVPELSRQRSRGRVGVVGLQRGTVVVESCRMGSLSRIQ